MATGRPTSSMMRLDGGEKKRVGGSGAMRSYATRRKGWVESDVPVFGHDQVDARPASELCDGRSGQSAVGEEVEAPRAHAPHRSDLSKWDRHSRQTRGHATGQCAGNFPSEFPVASVGMTDEDRATISG